jgi:hypothetical protein
VVVQLLITLFAGSILLAILMRKGKPDAGWAVGGLFVLWGALMALRTLH